VSTQTLPQPRTAGLGAKAGKVARAAIALLLFAQAIVFALVAAGGAIAAFGDRTYLDIPYPAWAEAIFYLIVFGAAAAATLIAGVALWQIAWGRGHRVGPRKRAGVWIALVVTALVFPGLEFVLATYSVNAEGAMPSDILSLVVLCGGLAACLAVWGLRSPLGWVGWKPVALAVAGSLVLLTGVAIMESAERHALIDSITHVFPPTPNSYPVCGPVPNERCAATAAMRRHGVVAWMAPPATYEGDLGFSALLVARGRAYQDLQSTADGARLKLVSNVPPGVNWYCRDGECTHHRTVRINGKQVTLFWGFSSGSGDFAVADWSRGGVRFALDAENPYHPVDQDWFVSVLRSVRYAQPEDHGA
jgi:hypothetical protein